MKQRGLVTENQAGGTHALLAISNVHHSLPKSHATLPALNKMVHKNMACLLMSLSEQGRD